MLQLQFNDCIPRMYDHLFKNLELSLFTGLYLTFIDLYINEKKKTIFQNEDKNF